MSKPGVANLLMERYAKFTGRLGVGIATSGPGGIQLLKGLCDAACGGQPVLAISLAERSHRRHRIGSGEKIAAMICDAHALIPLLERETNRDFLETS